MYIYPLKLYIQWPIFIDFWREAKDQPKKTLGAQGFSVSERSFFQKLEGAKLALSDDDITDFIDQANEVVISRLENGYTTGDVSADCWAFMMYLDDNYGERNNIDRIDLWDCISEDWPDEPVYHMAAMYLSWVESKMDRVILNPRQEMNLRSLIQHIGSIHSYRTLHFPDPEMRHRTFRLLRL